MIVYHVLLNSGTSIVFNLEHFILDSLKRNLITDPLSDFLFPVVFKHARKNLLVFVVLFCSSTTDASIR